ncbi:MobQ family relaxase [Methylomagnum sp.]
MAIYHLHTQIIGRKEGRSAVNCAAYRAGEKLMDERTGEVRDYTRKAGVLYSEITTPKNAPEWARDREILWNELEKSEKRKDSQLAREFDIALPAELGNEADLEKWKYLVKDYIKENFTRQGRAVDWSIHAPDREGDNRNYHVHFMIPIRQLEAGGFCEDKKQGQADYMNRKAQLEQWRQGWERQANHHLERWGHDERISCEALETQGIERKPLIHLGPHIAAMEERGIKTERGNENRALEEQNRELAETRRELAEVSKAIDQEQSREPEERIRMYRGIGKNVWEAREGEAVFFSTDPDRAAAFGALHFVDVTPDELAKFERPHSKRILEAEPIARNDYRTADPEILARLKSLEQERQHEAQPEPEQQKEQALGRTAGEIRLAYSLTDSGKGFAEALEDRGLILAEVTAADLAPWENRRELESLLYQQKKGVWTVAKGGLEALNEKQREKAAAAYQKWDHKDKADLKTYVEKVQKHKAERITELKGIVANEPTPEGPPLPWYIKQGDLVVINERGHLTRLTERTTGDDRDELDKYLATVDRAPLLNVSDAHAVALEARAATLQHRQAARTADVLERQAAERERLEEQHAEARAKIEQNPDLADSAKGWELKHLELSHEIESDSLEARQYRHRQWARVADPERDERGAALAADFEAAQDKKLLLDGFDLAPEEPAQKPDDSAAAFLKNREDARADRHADRIEADRARAPTGESLSFGRTAAQGFQSAAFVATKALDKVSDIADQLLGILGPAPPPLTFRDYIDSKDARERHFREQRESAERNATLDKIIWDRRQGKNLNPEAMRDDLKKLGRDDLETIKKYGDDGIKRLIDERERELLRHRERDRGRER